jgi:hypothetical protein
MTCSLQEVACCLLRFECNPAEEARRGRIASVDRVRFYEYIRSISIVSRHLKRVSCPLVDRIDIQTHVARVQCQEISGHGPGEQ